ncbi:hypothetical protein HPP92_008766 [Vanilla planifolia]|uniref:Uncharacterized protein n=1 Tax=Vanilla planifolia TaxID=51239 RepID=A0A835V431_VANPL|nr:hypothetical protein HPP92_008766 [Vanilla planifolia]
MEVDSTPIPTVRVIRLFSHATGFAADRGRSLSIQASCRPGGQSSLIDCEQGKSLIRSNKHNTKKSRLQLSWSSNKLRKEAFFVNPFIYGSTIFTETNKVTNNNLAVTRGGGLRGFFAGVCPRVGRAGPSVGIVVSFYEVVKYALHRRHQSSQDRIG